MPRDVRLIRSPLAVAGMVLTTVSAVVFLVVFLADLFGFHTNPYLGILFFLILPAVFVLGLLLIPFGVWVERRRRAAGKPPSAAHWPRIDLNDPTTRWRVVLVFALTLANIVIVSLAAYRGVEYMDSVSFCGQVCHTVMKPEFVAHQGAPHSQVTCVGCHVEPGAASLVKTKMAGTRRLVAVSFQNYPRPLPKPAEGLGPTRAICEQCHSPERAHGEKTRKVYEYSNTEQNTESVTTLRMRVGGGATRGIHWHANPAVEIDFVSTAEQPDVVPYVSVKDGEGTIREYTLTGATAAVPAGGSRRRMDCMDCHSRPSHPIAATPERAVNEMMAQGRIPKTLPFVHREAIKALKAIYPSEDAAMAGIADALGSFYRSQYQQLYMTQKVEVDRATSEVQNIYRQNVFPEMKVTFGTYPNNIGHVDVPGCFRCHDDNHKTKDGRTIGQDCDTCHEIE